MFYGEGSDLVQNQFRSHALARAVDYSSSDAPPGWPISPSLTHVVSHRQTKEVGHIRLLGNARE